MGINLGWIAVQSHLKEDLLEWLGLEPIGEAVHEVGQPYAMADTLQGWTVVTFRIPPPNIDKIAAKAAQTGTSFCGVISESVTASEIQGYQNGELLWSVECDRGRDRGLIIKGSPPEALKDIQCQREAEQAGPDTDDVDFLFEAPQDLGARLTGYRPGEGGLEWRLLGRKGRAASKGKTKARRSLSAAIKQELVPLFLSLGWSATNDKPDLALSDQIVRQIGDQHQTVWMDFASGDETFGTYIIIRFFTQRALTADSEWRVGGSTREPQGPPIFNRFPWGFARRKPEPDDPIQAAIEKAKTDILAIDTFLKGGEQASCIARLTAREYPPKPVEPPPPTIVSRIMDFINSDPLRRFRR